MSDKERKPFGFNHYEFKEHELANDELGKWAIRWITKDELKEMYPVKELGAGRELDALVAEKVMGVLEHGHRESCAWCKKPDADRYNPHFARYSTDIAAAWEVVGALRARGIEVYLMGNPKAPWRCRTVSERGFEDGRDFAWESADTAPLAICLAALKAVGAL